MAVILSLLDLKLLATLTDFLDMENDTHNETKVPKNTNTFLPSPSVQTSARCDGFSRVFDIQKTHNTSQSYQATAKDELYKRWNEEVMKILDLFDTRQKCQNCHRAHKCLETAVQWIEWHKMLLSMKVERLDEERMSVLMLAARIIECRYRKMVEGSECSRA